MTRVLVTGSGGFVGRALVQSLVNSGYQVRAASRSVCKIGGVESAVNSEIGSSTEWAEAMSGVSCVIHAAGRAHILKDEVKDPLAAFREVNVAGTKRAAEVAIEQRVKRFVYVSSIKVNGDATALDCPFTHADVPNPSDAYGQSKWEAEQELQRIAEGSDLEIVIVRPPLVYGPGVKANFARLMRLVQRGVPLPLGSVDNRRSLISLGNLVSLLTRCIDCPAAKGETFLASDGVDVSTPHLIRLLAEALNRKARLWPVPTSVLRLVATMLKREREIERLIGTLQVDIDHTKRSLDWEPPLTLEKGVRITVEGK